MRKDKHNRQPSEPVLPPIVITTEEAGRLSTLANSECGAVPRVAYFLARETERAKLVTDNCDLHGVVRMGSQVRYCDDETGLNTGCRARVSARGRYFTETHLGSYAGRGRTYWLVGWSGH